MSESIPATFVRNRIDEIDRKISELSFERKTLKSLLEMATKDHSTNGAAVAAGFFNVQDLPATEYPSPRDAVIEFVTATPGLTPTEIADSLKNRVNSRATDRRNVLRTTAAKLVGEGVLRKDDANRIFPK